MTVATRKDLAWYLGLHYPFTVSADPDGGFVVVFPDLPGCMTQAETWEEIGALADDARRLWLESAYGQNDLDIPLPSYPEEYSGKLNLRLPKSLHRQLAEGADREGVSLNSYIVTLLCSRNPQAQLERRLDALVERLSGSAPEEEPTQFRARSSKPSPPRTVKQRG
ncbi:MAG TPA: toxin-antitoxin system HicB family antitoxin [Thermomicrobiales bacterium]